MTDKILDKIGALYGKGKNYIMGIGTDWTEGRKARAVGKVIIPLVPVAVVIVLLYFLWSVREIIRRIGGIILTVGTIVFMCMQEEKPTNQQNTTAPDPIVMKHAKEGLDPLLDHIFLVSESLAEQTEIYSPRTIGELAYPDKTRCITIEDGVAVVTVRLNYVGEIDPAQFLERFNDRMAQKLNSGELRGKPPAIFTDKDNTPHTAIQAIRCVPVMGQHYIRLEVVRVDQAAVALLDKVAREKAPEAGGEDQLYDDDL